MSFHVGSSARHKSSSLVQSAWCRRQRYYTKGDRNPTKDGINKYICISITSPSRHVHDVMLRHVVAKLIVTQSLLKVSVNVKKRAFFPPNYITP